MVGGHIWIEGREVRYDAGKKKESEQDGLLFCEEDTTHQISMLYQ